MYRILHRIDVRRGGARASLRRDGQRGDGLRPLALDAPAGLPLQALRAIHRAGFHRPPCRVYKRRHLVSVLGYRRQPLFALDRRHGQRPRLRLWREGATTGQATIVGDDPLKLVVKDQGVFKSGPRPYAGRYPCGSLV